MITLTIKLSRFCRMYRNNTGRKAKNHLFFYWTTFNYRNDSKFVFLMDQCNKDSQTLHTLPSHCSNLYFLINIFFFSPTILLLPTFIYVFIKIFINNLLFSWFFRWFIIKWRTQTTWLFDSTLHVIFLPSRRSVRFLASSSVYYKFILFLLILFVNFYACKFYEWMNRTNEFILYRSKV